eukprot:CAMPEP_0181070922 /NCGR_PEP_ID=MMETSP1070-20121207/27743_1 /TAXON_ID=265543 /ORGANISM="Minutocellus polymorphus, Strain NH13" /LENGTH=282 /DNA_ID=CAMNT_0023151837 /DNA_START=324 /DNA_END=1169 /DNA_ORIENTATION=+
MSVSGDGSPDDLRGCVESELGLLVVEAKKNGLCQAEVAVEAAQRLGICDYELARELRVDIGRAFSAEKDKFRGFIPCEDISDDAALGQYAKDIAETNEWGDHIQLHITQSLLKRPLEIYNVRSRTVTYIRGPGDERTEPFPSGPVVHGGAEEDRPIRFIYNGVDHFDGAVEPGRLHLVRKSTHRTSDARTALSVNGSDMAGSTGDEFGGPASDGTGLVDSAAPVESVIYFGGDVAIESASSVVEQETAVGGAAPPKDGSDGGGEGEARGHGGAEEEDHKEEE